MAVNLGGVATALLAFDPISPNKLTPGTITALCLLPISLIFIFYAIRVFFFRSDQIRDRSIHRWDDPIGPVILCTIFVIAILIQFFLKVIFFHLISIYIFILFSFFLSLTLFLFLLAS